MLLKVGWFVGEILPALNSFVSNIRFAIDLGVACGKRVVSGYSHCRTSRSSLLEIETWNLVASAGDVACVHQNID